MGSLLQDVLGLFSKKKFTQPIPYVPSKDDYFVLSTKGDSSLNVMAYLPKVEQTLISAKQFADAIVAGTNTTYDYSSAQDGDNVDLILTGSDATIDIVKLLAGTNITLVDNGSNNITINSTDEFIGTVTSIDAGITGDALSISGVPITTAGSIDFSWGGTALEYIDGEGNLQAFPTVGSMTSFLIKGQTGVTHTITDGLTVTVNGGAKISTVGSIVDTIEIIHDDTTRTDTTSTATPIAGATFTAIDVITSDAQGHITGVNTKTITLPQSADAGVTKIIAGDRITISPTSGLGDVTITADIQSGGGTVTSVGLAAPSAFIVSNSPVTGIGTLTLTGAGLTTDYIDGTGALQTFPSIPSVPTNIVETIVTVNGTYIDMTPTVATSGDVTVSATLSAVTGTDTSGLFLSKDNLWSAIPGGNPGTVTVVNYTSDIAAFTASVTNGTSQPLIELNLNGGTAGQFLQQDGNWATIPGGNFVSLTTTGASGDAATLVSGVLNIPTPVIPAVPFTSLTTTGTSGVATLASGVLNIPNYAVSGGGTVTDFSAVVMGGVPDAISLQVFDSTTTPRLEVSFGGVAGQYINGLGVLTTSDFMTTLTTTGASGAAATYVAGTNTLNIPTPVIPFTSLTTTGSGLSTLVSGVLNIPLSGGGSMSSWTAGDGTGIEPVTDGLEVQFRGLDKISTNIALVGTDIQLDIDHDDTTRTDTTSAVSPAAGGTFTVIDSITQDATGHATAANVKTITLPGAASVPTMTSTVLGIGKLFSDVVQTQSVIQLYSDERKTYGVQFNSSNQLVVNVPWTDSAYTLPLMTTTLRGGAMLGSVLTNAIDADTPEREKRTYGVHMVDGTEQLAVYVPWDASGGGVVQSLTTTGHTTATLTGGVLNIPDSLQGFGLQTATVSTGSPLTGIATNGLYLLTPRSYAGFGNVGFVPAGGTDKLFLRGDGIWSAIGSSYSLPTMTSTILGGGKLFSDVTAAAVEPLTETGKRTYGVQMNSSDQLCVNVPWTGGTYTGWLLGGDLGTAEPIANGNTANIAGGIGLTTSVTAPDTVTVDLDNTGVTAGSYTNANVTVNAQGQVLTATNGSGTALPYTSYVAFWTHPKGLPISVTELSNDTGCQWNWDLSASVSGLYTIVPSAPGDPASSCAGSGGKNFWVMANGQSTPTEGGIPANIFFKDVENQKVLLNFLEENGTGSTKGVDRGNIEIRLYTIR